MHAREQQRLVQLHTLENLSRPSLRRLLLHYGGADYIWQSHPSEWRGVGLAPEACDALRSLLTSATDGGKYVQSALGFFAREAVTIVPIGSSNYPALLLAIPDPPPLLYCLGEVEHLQAAQLAIVGSRNASAGGMRAATEFASAAVAADLLITSGLARGVDGAAHRGALDAGGVTVAVMATGIDRVYPVRNRQLAAEICQTGCLVTELPPGAPPLKSHFPSRNRIISGLSLGVLVIEASLPSGSLITANLACEQGREVFAMPWSPLHVGGHGCLKLLRDGAKMAVTLTDILEELGPLYRFQEQMQPLNQDVKGSHGHDNPVLELIGFEEVATDELIRLSGLGTAETLALLSQLEVMGVIQQGSLGYVRT